MNSNGILALLDCGDQAREDLIIQNWNALDWKAFPGPGYGSPGKWQCILDWLVASTPLLSFLHGGQRGPAAWVDCTQPACLHGSCHGFPCSDHGEKRGRTHSPEIRPSVIV